MFLGLTRILADDPFHEAWVEVNLSGEHLADRRHHFRGRLFLRDVAVRARTQGAFRVERLGVHRENQDGHLDFLRTKILQQFQAARTFESNIDDRQRRLLAHDGGETVGRVIRLRANRHIRLLVDQVSQLLAEHRVILDEHDLRSRLTRHVASILLPATGFRRRPPCLRHVALRCCNSPPTRRAR